MSPFSPSYGGQESARYSPGPMMSPGHGATGKTPQYGSTPLYGYNSPSYANSGAGYGDSGALAGYSPGGASQHSAYSPTGLMGAYQSPSYSPTTPNYG